MSSTEMANSSAMRLANLIPLLEQSEGRAEIQIGLIDGPVDLLHPGFGNSIRDLTASADGCAVPAGVACQHGTFVAGLLAARRDVNPQGLCPGCSLVVRPIFPEGTSATATLGDVAAALAELIATGVRVVNLSAAPSTPTAFEEREFQQVLDEAAQRGVLVVAAAGNQAAIGGWTLTRHPAVITVMACDSIGRPFALSNLSLTGGRRGVLAPGVDIVGLSPGGGTRTLSGTSAATPFVAATVALLWSLIPEASATAIRNAVVFRKDGRATLIPPLLDGGNALKKLSILYPRTRSGKMNSPEDETPILEAVPHPALDAPMIVPQSEGGGCGCRGKGSAAAGPPTNVYAIGQIEARFPTIGVEKEFAQATARQQTSDMTDRGTMFAVLSRPENRYLLRKLCWVFSIENLQTYLLQPRHAPDLDLLLEAIRPNPRKTDVDVVIGTRGDLAPPEYCNGLGLPLVTVDQLYSFDIDALVKSVPRPAESPKDKFEAVAEEVFARISQLADNAGATDEHRALNYLLIRYPAVYAHTAEAHNKNMSLTGIDVRPSRLAGVRRVVDVILTYTHRQTDVNDKAFVRVDVTEQFPFLASKLAPYFDR